MAWPVSPPRHEDTKKAPRSIPSLGGLVVNALANSDQARQIKSVSKRVLTQESQNETAPLMEGLFF
jgi:hypothetical protein